MKAVSFTFCMQSRFWKEKGRDMLKRKSSAFYMCTQKNTVLHFHRSWFLLLSNSNILIFVKCSHTFPHKKMTSYSRVLQHPSCSCIQIQYVLFKQILLTKAALEPLSVCNKNDNRNIPKKFCFISSTLPTDPIIKCLGS